MKNKIREEKREKEKNHNGEILTYTITLITSFIGFVICLMKAIDSTDSNPLALIYWVIIVDLVIFVLSLKFLYKVLDDNQNENQP